MNQKEHEANMIAACTYGDLSHSKRAKVGCVFVKERRVISIGVNGTPSGWDNVCEHEDGHTHPYVLHAESNAIAKLARSTESGEGATVYCTYAPCQDCSKQLLQIGVKAVYYLVDYRNSDGLEWMRRTGIHVEKMGGDLQGRIETMLNCEFVKSVDPA